MLIARKDKRKGTEARGAKECAQRGDAFRGRCDGKRTGKIRQFFVKPFMERGVPFCIS